jgi:hypothetical protein
MPYYNKNNGKLKKKKNKNKNKKPDLQVSSIRL